MGLHDSLLDVPERLRIWQYAGVRYFYVDPDQAAPTVEGAVDAAQSVVPPPDSPAPFPVAPSPPVVPRPEAPVFSVASEPAAWPDPWPAIFAKAPRHPRLVITYQELGYDLTGQSDPRRGKLWRTLLRDVGLAGKGVVAFWPLFLPKNKDVTLDTNIFATGVKLFAPQVLAVFGQPAAHDLFKVRDALTDIVQEILPDPEALLAGDTEAWNHVREVLGRL